MRAIKKYVEMMEDEIESAKEYAEKALEHKAMGDIQTANQYREMANDELKHASFEHEWATKKIDEISKVYTPPIEMQESWEKAHKKYVEEVAWIRQMLAM